MQALSLSIIHFHGYQPARCGRLAGRLSQVYHMFMVLDFIGL